MDHVSAEIDQAVSRFAAQCESKQWVLAGVSLGALQELAKRLNATCRMAEDALCFEAERGREPERSPT